MITQTIVTDTDIVLYIVKLIDNRLGLSGERVEKGFRESLGVQPRGSQQRFPYRSPGS